MKVFLIVLFLAIIVTLIFGFYIRSTDLKTGEFCIGISIVGLFLFWMPLFIYHRWKNKNVKDYMLTKENIEKMREEGRKKKL
ncbi:MAG: hypothetical protein E2O83_07190 [Bacteroidetes bacterium]|nr:MAG: hypothetical protein E2O86_05570 [Bacteroidota bacterium]TDI75547.1 MAG: hypothetical protein E2O87_01825 [Bacteroidota bacterium]TDI77949.1 MAG: hypothetical protein E2O83_07190 [Bacteroidota bacterium]